MFPNGLGHHAQSRDLGFVVRERRLLLETRELGAGPIELLRDRVEGGDAALVRVDLGRGGGEQLVSLGPDHLEFDARGVEGSGQGLQLGHGLSQRLDLRRGRRGQRVTGRLQLRDRGLRRRKAVREGLEFGDAQLEGRAGLVGRALERDDLVLVAFPRASKRGARLVEIDARALELSRQRTQELDLLDQLDRIEARLLLERGVAPAPFLDRFLGSAKLRGERLQLEDPLFETRQRCSRGFLVLAAAALPCGERVRLLFDLAAQLRNLLGVVGLGQLRVPGELLDACAEALALRGSSLNTRVLRSDSALRRPPPSSISPRSPRSVSMTLAC